MEQFSLIARNTIYPQWVNYALLLSLFFLALLRLRHQAIFSHLATSILYSHSSVPFKKEEIHFFALPSWILMLNYFLTSTLTAYLLVLKFPFLPLITILFPAFYYLFLLLGFFSIILLSGEKKRLNDNLIDLYLTSHTLGIMLLPLAVIVLVNPQFQIEAFIAIGVVFFLFHCIRIIKGGLTAFRNKVRWYYIILYLCTLESWPVMIALYLLQPYLIK